MTDLGATHSAGTLVPPPAVERPAHGARPASATGGSPLAPRTGDSRDDAPFGLRAILRAPGARELLVLMLCTDALLIAGHLVHAFTPYLSGQSFHLATERGFGEVFQYVKVFWVAVSFLWLGVHTAQRAHFVWPLIFGYLLVDDAFRVHERLGRGVARSLGPAPGLGLRAQDLGEFVVVAVIGAITLLLIGLAYLRGSAAFRSIARRVGALLVLFGLFAGGVDLLHAMVDHVPLLNALFAALEDGGELVVMSAICAYAVGLLLRRNGPVAMAT
jgi:hypothetical protein